MENTENIIGFVEHFEPTAIQGWALRHDGKPIHLGLHIDGSRYPLDAAWSERSDVAQQHGAQFMISGFRCTLPREVTMAVKDALRNSKPLEVHADGVVLQNVAKMPIAASLLQAEPLLASVRSDELNCVIESWGHFTIDGWAVVSGHAPANYSLVGNGVALDCTVMTCKRPDVAQALGIATLDAGFEIELPGYLWEAVPEDEDARLEIRAGDLVLTAEPLVLSHVKAARWISEICRMNEGQDKQYRLLLALEHVHYGKLYELLDDDTRILLRHFAIRMQLDDFIEGHQIDSAGVEAPAQSPVQALLERALRVLNARLVGSADSVLSHVRVVLQEERLIGEARDRFLMAIVPLLCKSGEFPALSEFMSLSRLIQLEEASGLWEMSLALPALARAADVQRASGVLLNMSKRLDHGWLNTECVRYVIEETLRLEAEGLVEPNQAEELRHSFVALLDGFKGEWFSRLHDLELVEAMLLVIGKIGNYSDAHRRDMVTAAIRIYGLCPPFWERMPLYLIEGNHDLVMGFNAWNILSKAFAKPNDALVLHLPEILDSIQYFMRQNSKEANNVLREVIANTLPNFDGSIPPVCRQLVDILVANDRVESMRIAASPSSGCLSDTVLLENVFGSLNETLRVNNGRHPCSPVFEMQREASRLLREASVYFEKSDINSISTCIAALHEKSIILSANSNYFLGADLLAQSYRIAQPCNLPERNSIILRLDEMLHKAISRTSGNGILPMPIQASIAQLVALPNDDLLTPFLNEIEALIRHRFGDRYEYIFKSNSSTSLIDVAGRGWPSGILVVIYSCRKYLESRVAAIRRTWMQDLERRNIPYIVLVGDGDNTLKGDILALDVPDHYEDLPKKTLRLFDWVYQHTNAQYVLKIDDDCYLDVDSYLESLTYRKYAYYGQIVVCKDGEMDRRWHMSKSQSRHSRRTLDKSPEPSIYAKGGGAYTLSREAIKLLLQTARTDAGKRLTAASYMEDKLVGDLLAMSGIMPSNEDYEFFYRQRGHGNGIPVSLWENTFFPSKISPTQVVHLDNVEDQAVASEYAKSDALWPKKIWPTYCLPSIDFNKNQLELITDLVRVEALQRHNIVVVAVVRNEIIMLPHFLEHYRKLGIKYFIFVDNCSNDGTTEYLNSQNDVVLYSCDTEYKHSHYGVSWQQAVISNHCLGKWVIIADADEFLVFENSENVTLSSFIEKGELEGFNGFIVHMIDMYPFGDLGDAKMSEMNPFDAAPFFDKDAQIELVYGGGHFSNSQNYVNGLRHRLAPSRINAYVSQKYAVFKYFPWIRFSEGVHYSANMNVSTRPVYFAHFKYHSEFKNKVIQEIKRKQHYNNAEEYFKYLAMLSESKGGFGAKEISVKYENSFSFANLFGHLIYKWKSNQ